MDQIRPRPRRLMWIAALSAGALALQACSTIQPNYSPRAGGSPGPRPTATYKVGKPYQVAGIWYVPQEQPDYDQVGVASWYGQDFHMKATASGELFDMDIPSAAHTTLPLPSIVEVTNLDNGRRMKVRVNDRGPFVGNRIIDLSQAAARELGFERNGLARVRVRYVGRADLPGNRASGRQFAAVGAPLVASQVAQPAPQQQPRPEPTPIAMVALAPAAVPAAAPVVIPPSYRIQAGAFLDPANAQRAQAQLLAAGPTAIEPLERDGVTLYRVMVDGGADELAASAVRDRVAASGFADARLLAPF